MTYNGVEFLQQDLQDMFETILPTCRKEGQYLHPGPLAIDFAAAHGETKMEALNTDGHLRSSLLRRSVTLLIIDGSLDLGNFGHIYFGDFDQTRPRMRQTKICVIGS